MDRKRVFELVIIGLWLMIAIIMAIRYNQNYFDALPMPEKLTMPAVPESQKGKEFDIRKVIVLNGDTFDLTLKDDGSTRILGKLNVLSTANAKEEVVDLFNHVSSPKVVLREKQLDGRWIVDIFVIKDNQKINLSEWLVSNNLVYK